MRTMLYRFFLAPLTIIFAAGLLLACPFAANAQDDGVYTVQNVQVDVSGTSALDARKKAFAEARRVAYGRIADKLLNAEQRPNLVMPDDRMLASLVRDFEIVEEKMTTKRYAGTLNIRFTPAAVKRTIQIADAPQSGPSGSSETAVESVENAIAATPAPDSNTAIGAIERDNADTDRVYSPRNKAVQPVAAPHTPLAVNKAERTLVLPWYGPIGRQTIWGASNPWRDAWERDAAIAGDKGNTVVLPVGDVDDLRDYSPPQPLSRRGNIEGLMKRYAATRALLAVAEPSAGDSLTVSLYELQNGAPVPVGRFGMDAAAMETAFAEAVKKSLISLKALPTANPMPSVTPVSVSPETDAPINAPNGGQYRTLARFSGLQQWVAMRQALTRVPGIEGLEVRAISPSQASIDFTYKGDSNVLMAVLAQSGLALDPAPQGISTGDRPAQYTLAFKKGM